MQDELKEFKLEQTASFLNDFYKEFGKLQKELVNKLSDVSKLGLLRMMLFLLEPQFVKFEYWHYINILRTMSCSEFSLVWCHVK